MIKSNDIQSIIQEFRGKKCKLKLLTGELITGTLSEIQHISSLYESVQVTETVNNELINAKTILLSQIDALALA
ncbi:MAG: hypothetical protein WCK78_02400 [Paludibacter sp.]